MKAEFTSPPALPKTGMFKPDIEFVRVCIDNQDVVRLAEHNTKLSDFPPPEEWGLLYSNVPPLEIPM